MVRAGAAGTTASELDTVFGFPAGGRDEAYNAIMRQLTTMEVPSPWMSGAPKLRRSPAWP
jgi:serpin B